MWEVLSISSKEIVKLSCWYIEGSSDLKMWNFSEILNSLQRSLDIRSWLYNKLFVGAFFHTFFVLSYTVIFVTHFYMSKLGEWWNSQNNFLRCFIISNNRIGFFNVFFKSNSCKENFWCWSPTICALIFFCHNHCKQIFFTIAIVGANNNCWRSFVMFFKAFQCCLRQCGKINT